MSWLKNSVILFIVAAMVLAFRPASPDKFVNGASDSVMVRILNEVGLQSIMVSFESGKYKVLGDGNPILNLPGDFLLQITLTGDLLEIKNELMSYGKFNKLEFIGMDTSNALKFKPLNPVKAQRAFWGNIKVSKKGNGLEVINKLPLNDYIAGVVESEVGLKAPYEYYKVQSILCRTYALGHLRRHEEEGYNLCDNVHCQAYRGKQKGSADIIKSCRNTKNLVVVDAKNELILAAFHSNSGGQTCNSEDVWNGNKTYLRSVADSFSVGLQHYKWEKRFPKQKWLNYFKDKYKYPVTDSLCCNELFNFHQDQRKNLFINNPPVYLKVMRNDWGLNSTLFSVRLEGNEVVLTGKGYGHGVGLSQEGAIKMAKLGYNYKQIIHHYYRGVHLIELSMMDFFKE